MSQSLRRASIVLFGLALGGCGGGGGDPGTSNASAIAGRYTVSMVTRPSTSVFYNGTTTTAYVTLTQNCSTTGTTTTTTSTCGGTQPLDSVAGQTVTLTSSDPSALQFTPATGITDSEGKVQFNVQAASRSVSEFVQVTASAALSGYRYNRTVSLGVNNQVDASISAADSGQFEDLDFSSDCGNYHTVFVNVKNAANIVQSNSVISVAGGSNAEPGLKDLGVFGSLGKVWLLQVRPPIATCDTTGTTTAIGDVEFTVNPGDGSAPYVIGYRLTFKTQ